MIADAKIAARIRDANKGLDGKKACDDTIKVLVTAFYELGLPATAETLTESSQEWWL